MGDKDFPSHGSYICPSCGSSDWRYQTKDDPPVPVDHSRFLPPVKTYCNKCGWDGDIEDMLQVKRARMTGEEIVAAAKEKPNHDLKRLPFAIAALILVVVGIVLLSGILNTERLTFSDGLECHIRKSYAYRNREGDLVVGFNIYPGNNGYAKQRVVTECWLHDLDGNPVASTSKSSPILPFHTPWRYRGKWTMHTISDVMLPVYIYMSSDDLGKHYQTSCRCYKMTEFWRKDSNVVTIGE